MGFSLVDDSLGLRAGGIGPREQSRQATHLALTLELLLLLEGQGAGEHCAGVVEAVLDHVLVLVCEPASNAIFRNDRITLTGIKQVYFIRNR